MEDNGRAGIPFSERLKRLRAHELASNSLSWTNALRINRRDLTGEYGANDGVFVQSYHTEGGMAFEFRQVPSSIHDIKHESWSWTFPLPLIRHRFHLEPTFDLFILWYVPRDSLAIGSSTIFYVLKLSTGEPHVLASNAPFSISKVNFIKVCGTRLVVGEISEVDIYDWRSGELLMVRLFLQIIRRSFALNRSPSHSADHS